MIFHDFHLLDKIDKFCKQNELSYIDGITHFCETNSVEIEAVAVLIKKDPVFTAKMQIEAENLNFIKRTSGAKLPI